MVLLVQPMQSLHSTQLTALATAHHRKMNARCTRIFLSSMTINAVALAHRNGRMLALHRMLMDALSLRLTLTLAAALATIQLKVKQFSVLLTALTSMLGAQLTANTLKLNAMPTTQALTQ
jgi:hypothetical protein